MLNTKLDLYKAEWLDLVFSDRNKAYGAYELRNHYSGNLVRAMVIAFSVIISAGVTVNVIARNRPAPDKVIVVDLPPVLPPPVIEPKIKKVEPEKQKAEKATAPVKTDAFPPMRVVPEEVNVDPPIISELGDNIAAKATQGTGTVAAVDPPNTLGTGTGIEDKPDESVHEIAGLEVFPEPYGGAEAWGKFLNKNLRYPAQARDAEKSGRVILNFVIEKDGSLSNIKVVRGPGYGMDEEALRVLKLAKAWKPGIQNKQNVRVSFSIPINFQLATE